MEIKNICKYHGFEALSLIEDYTTIDEFKAIDPYVREYISHMFDFEPFTFFVINDDTVLTVDSPTGDVLSADPVSEWIRQTEHWAMSNMHMFRDKSDGSIASEETIREDFDKTVKVTGCSITFEEYLDMHYTPEIFL